MHMMLFGAASIDVVITIVLYICTPCFAANTSDYDSMLFSSFLRDLVYCETAGLCFCSFFSCFAHLLLLFFSFLFRVCCLHIFFANHRFARKILPFFFSRLSVLSLRKKLATHFCGTIFCSFLFALRSALLYISSVPVCCIEFTPLQAASRLLFYLCLCGPFLRRLFHFYFVLTSQNFGFVIFDVMLCSHSVFGVVFLILFHCFLFAVDICLFNNNLLSSAQIYVDHCIAERY